MGGPSMDGGFGDMPPSGGMFGGANDDDPEALFGLEPLELPETGDANGFLSVGLHFHGAMRDMKK